MKCGFAYLYCLTGLLALGCRTGATSQSGDDGVSARSSSRSLATTDPQTEPAPRGAGYDELRSRWFAAGGRPEGVLTIAEWDAQNQLFNRITQNVTAADVPWLSRRVGRDAFDDRLRRLLIDDAIGSGDFSVEMDALCQLLDDEATAGNEYIEYELQTQTMDAVIMLYFVYQQSPSARPTIIRAFKRAFPDRHFNPKHPDAFVEGCYRWYAYLIRVAELEMNPNYPSRAPMQPSGAPMEPAPPQTVGNGKLPGLFIIVGPLRRPPRWHSATDPSSRPASSKSLQ